jgi:hypothetical protein
LQNSSAFASAREQMRSAIRQFRAYGKGVVEVTNQNKLPHHVLAELLYEFAYIDEHHDEEPAAVTFTYAMGQEAMPVPLYCLRPPQVRQFPREPFHGAPLRVSLVSMRHLSLDHIVDMAWLLNKEIPQDETYVQEDLYCYARTHEQLHILAAKGIRCIHLYQTGYQAAVIGFYRALIEYLREQQEGRDAFSSLEVTPYYYDRNQGHYWKGSTWS